MKGIIIFILQIAVLTLFAQDAARMNIAVLDLEGKKVPQEEASILSDKLRGELLKTGKFDVIERSQMDEILKEQGFQQTGCTDQSCIVEMGQLMGVKMMIVGSVGKIGNMYLVSIRMIDVQQGKIVKNVDKEVEGSIESVLKYGIPYVAAQMAGPSETRVVQKTVQTPADRTYTATKGGWGPFFASCFLGPRVGLEMNEGKPVQTLEWVALALNFTLGGGGIVRGIQGMNNGCGGFMAGCCIGPRVGEQLHKRRIRTKEYLMLIPVVQIIPAVLIAVEAMDGKAMTDIAQKENLQR
jgi:TolB-like protein